MANITFAITCIAVVPVTITTAASHSVVAGAPLAITFAATGGAEALTYSISTAEPTRYQINGDVLSWADNAAQSAGGYTFDLTAADGQGNSDTLTITITVTAAPGGVVLPGAVTGLTATPINETTAVLAFTDASAATSYHYSANGSPEKPVPADRRIRLLSPSTPYTIRVWGRNADGDGTAAAANCTTLSPSQSVNDVWRGMQSDEVNRSEYSFSFTVGAGADNKFLLIGAVTHTGGGAPHVQNSVLFNDVACSAVVKTPSSATLQLGYFSIPWPSGSAAGTYVVKVRVRDASDVAALSALRCACSLREMVSRSSTPVATYSDTAGAVSQSVTLAANQIVLGLTAALSASTTVDLSPDLNRLTIETDSELWLPTLNCIAGYYSSPDGETRTIGADWIDTVTLTSALSPRMVAVVYDAPIAVTVGIVPRAADDLVDKWAVDTHLDWNRSTAGPWHWGADASPQLSNIITVLGEIGVRYFRASPYKTLVATSSNSNSQLYKYMRQFYDTYGIQGFGPPGTLDDLMADIEQAISRTETHINTGGKRRWLAYEGANESNHLRPAGWNTNLVDYMLTIKAYRDANYPDADIIGPSIWGRNQADIATLAATPGWSQALQEYGCIHTYNGGRKPTTSGDPLTQQGDETGGPTTIPFRDTFVDHAALFGNLPMWITEVGYEVANPQGIKGWTMPSTWVSNYSSARVSNKAFMKYLLRYFMAALEIGLEFGEFERFSQYVAIDDVTTRPNKCFGLTYPNEAQTALIKRPVYYALQRFLNLFKDKTWNYGAGAWQYAGSAPTLTPLNYKITGGNGLTRPILSGQAQKGMLWRKADGTYLIPLYQDEVSWDQSATADYSTPVDPTQYWCNADLDPARRLVTFDAGAVVTKIEWFEPTFDNSGAYGSNGAYGSATTATARKTANAVQTMTIQVPDHVGVIKVTP